MLNSPEERKRVEKEKRIRKEKGNGQKISIQDRTTMEGSGEIAAQITGMLMVEIIAGILLRRMRGKEAIMYIKEGEIETGLIEITGKGEERMHHLHRERSRQKGSKIIGDGSR